MPREEGKRKEDQGLVTRFGPIEVDWPRSVGYFGGIGLALAYDLIAPPIAIFAAAIPLIKLLKPPGTPMPLRMVADALEGAAKPLGGDSEATVRVAGDDEPEGGTPPPARRRR